MKTNINKYIDKKTKNVYEIKTTDKSLKKEIGLSEEIVRNISREKNEPEWVLDIRLKALKQYYELSDPNWGPNLEELDIEKIATYIKPDYKMNDNWEDVPKDIKDVFDKLGIPEAEKKSLAGVGAQYDS